MSVLSAEQAMDLIWKAHMDIDDPREALRKAVNEIHTSLYMEFKPAGTLLVDGSFIKIYTNTLDKVTREGK